MEKEAMQMAGYQRVFAWVIVPLIVAMLVVTLVSEGVS
jgi:hypothetical protein